MKTLFDYEENCHRLELIIEHQKDNVRRIQENLTTIEERTDGFHWKSSIDEKHLQRKELTVKTTKNEEPLTNKNFFQQFHNECSEFQEEIEQIAKQVEEESIEDGTLTTMILDTRQKAKDLVERIRVKRNRIDEKKIEIDFLLFLKDSSTFVR